MIVKSFVICMVFMVVPWFFKAAYAQPKIRPDQALKFVGKQAVVCGQVMNTLYDPKHPKKVTILNLDRAYPNHIFTIVIYGEYRSKFAKPPEVNYRGKRVCVSGTVSTFQGRARMLVDRPEQIKLDQ